ncbi:MAG: hypothetical protein AAF989_02775 [Planctomycetota bacterium]
MKFTKVQWIAITCSIAVTAVAAGSSSAQGLASGEFIVGQRVVSDTAVQGGIVSGDCASGNCGGGEVIGGGVASGRNGYDRPDLFYNYYTQGNANRTNAQMYISPVPVPPFVGHTYGTYQPWYPQHYLYWHKDRYHNHYDNGRGLNRTRATYYAPPVRQAASNLYWNYLRLPR